MGVYIPNLEMPTSCIACLLNFGEKRPEHGLTIYCPYSDGVISWRDKAFDNGRLASCGIVPVPAHGRLIDADALAEHKFVCIPHVSIDGKDAGTAYRLGWNTAIEAIMENAETIIGGE